MTPNVLSLLLAPVLLVAEDDVRRRRAGIFPPPTVAEQITLELTRPNDDPVGRPLPVAAHWNTGRPSSPRPGWDPDFVLDFLDAGEYVIPTFQLRMPTLPAEPWAYYESGLQRARALGIPIATRFTQWDRPFTDDDVDRNFLLEASVNPPRPWDNATVIEVWSLALQLGEAPHREWPLFAYAPLRSHADVTITVPDFGDVTIDGPRGNGAFRLLRE